MRAKRPNEKARALLFCGSILKIRYIVSKRGLSSESCLAIYHPKAKCLQTDSYKK